MAKIHASDASGGKRVCRPTSSFSVGSNRTPIARRSLYTELLPTTRSSCPHTCEFMPKRTLQSAADAAPHQGPPGCCTTYRGPVLVMLLSSRTCLRNRSSTHTVCAVQRLLVEPVVGVLGFTRWQFFCPIRGENIEKLRHLKELALLK